MANRLDKQPTESPQIIWDCGTVYDLFVSLYAVYNPDSLGLRGKWAAGVRSRLPVEVRETLETMQLIMVGDKSWCYSLPQPKNGLTALKCLAALTPAERVSILTDFSAGTLEIKTLAEQIGHRQRWDEHDRQALQQALKAIPAPTLLKFENKSKEFQSCLLDCWANPDDYGERLLTALQTYYDVFFAEEEKRLEPVLKQALERAKTQAKKLSLPDLLEELSQGIRYTEPFKVSRLVLVPSFWITPLVSEAYISADCEVILFGARPADASLVPGELVPETLYRTLKALADPTRLRILRYLTSQPLSPAQLARRLRLRAPTVIHHLDTLRLAGLVYLTLEDGYQRRYTARTEAIAATCHQIQNFLADGDPSA